MTGLHDGGRRVLAAWFLAVGGVLSVVVAACAGGAADPEAARRASRSELPVAPASVPSEVRPATPQPTASATPVMPEWEEPDDPVAAYHELIDKVAYMRANPSMDIFWQIYAPNSRMAGHRNEVRRRMRRGIRVVEGRTVIDSVEVLQRDNDTAFVEVHGREERWVTIKADGARSEEPTQCEQFIVELRDGGEGWRIATVIIDEDKSFWRCEP